MTEPRPVILAVDDVPDNLALVRALLRQRYEVRTAASGEQALAMIQSEPPDLILLDVMMPGLDGYETCSRLKADERFRRIPVLFLTARAEIEDEEKGFSLGAVDYITKPLNPSLLLARVNTHLQLKQTQDALNERNEFLEAEIVRRVNEITLLQEVAITAMASLAETRDRETGGHIQRTANYVRVLGEHLRCQGIYDDVLTPEAIYLMAKSAPLHDIGKMGIPDMILWKPAKLNAEEFALVQRHPLIGKRAIEGAEKLLGTSDSFLRYAKEMAYAHHERWNGTGYPENLAGEQIPVSARLMALADVYDAIISRRVYKDPMPHANAVEIIREVSGKQFDPVVVQAFLTLADRFQEISETFRDEWP